MRQFLYKLCLHEPPNRKELVASELDANFEVEHVQTQSLFANSHDLASSD